MSVSFQFESSFLNIRFSEDWRGCFATCQCATTPRNALCAAHKHGVCMPVPIPLNLDFH